MKKLLLVSFLIIAMVGMANASGSRLGGMGVPAWATPDDWECIYLSPAFATRLAKPMIILDLGVGVDSSENHWESWVAQAGPPAGPKEFQETTFSGSGLNPMIGYIQAGSTAFGVYFNPKIESMEMVDKTENDADTSSVLDNETTQTWDTGSILNLGALFAMKLGDMSLGIAFELSGEGMENLMEPLVYEKEVILNGVKADALTMKEEDSYTTIAPSVGLNMPIGEGLLGFTVGVALISGTDQQTNEYVAPPAPGDYYLGEQEISAMMLQIRVLPELKMGADQMLKGILSVSILSGDSKYKFTGKATDITEQTKINDTTLSGMMLEIGGALNSKLTKDCKSILGLSFGMNSMEMDQKMGNTLAPTIYNTSLENRSEMNITVLLGLENNFSDSIVGRVGIATRLISSSSRSAVDESYAPAVTVTRDDESSTSDVLGNWRYSAGISVLPSENISIDADIMAQPVDTRFGSNVDFKQNLPAPVVAVEDTSSSTEINMSLAITVKM